MQFRTVSNVITGVVAKIIVRKRPSKTTFLKYIAFCKPIYRILKHIVLLMYKHNQNLLLLRTNFDLFVVKQLYLTISGVYVNVVLCRFS